MKTGPTLADSKGTRRIAKLEETRLNIWLQILQAQDKITCITHEIELERAKLPKPGAAS